MQHTLKTARAHGFETIFLTFPNIKEHQTNIWAGSARPCCDVITRLSVCYFSLPRTTVSPARTDKRNPNTV